MNISVNNMTLRIRKPTDFKPYRIVYQVGKKTVYIHCVFDGRRDMPAEGGLQERLLREG